MNSSQPTDSAAKAELAARDRARSMIDRVISDRYRIRELIAMGGMGAVYRGEHLLLKKRIAIKILHPETENLPELVKRFEREAIAGAHIQHPNVATATDFGKLADGSYFLILEYVNGKTLAQIIQEGPLPPRRAALISRQMASALDGIHRMDIVHRDLKPRNVMVVDGPSDAVKIIDLGLAKVKLEQLSSHEAHLPDDDDDDDQQNLTVAGTIFGTVAYLAPEAADGMDAVDPRSDLYALGLILYEMLCGERPFTAVNPVELFMQHRYEAPPPFAKRKPHLTIPAQFEALAMKLLAKEPAKRYQSAQDVVDAIDDALNELGMGRTNSVIPPPPPNSVIPPPSTSSAIPPPAAAKSAPPAQRDPGAPTAKTSPQKPQASPIVAPIAAPMAVEEEPEELAEPEEPPAPPAPRRRKKSPVSTVLTVLAGLSLGALGAFALRVTQNKTAPGAPSAPTAVSAPQATATAPLPSAAAPTAPEASAAATPPPAASASSEAAVNEAPRLSAPEVAALQKKFKHAFRFRDWRGAGRAAVELGKGSPETFKDTKFVLLVQNVAIALSKEQAEADLMQMLGDDLGSDGLDVLYAFIEGQGKSPVATTAAKLLADEKRLAKATPALRIALEFRQASCVRRLELFDRATNEGDSRVRLALETLGRACFPDNANLNKAIFALRVKFPNK